MRLGAVPATLPEGYEFVHGRRGLLAVERGARAALLAAGFGPDGGEDLATSDLSGRAPLGSIELPGERWLVRRFHHGGALRALGEHLFLEPARPFRELASACALRAAGFATPRVIGARALRSRWLGWRLALVSVRVESAVDGADVLEQLRRGELGFPERRRFLATLGTLVGRLHGAGFLHADLNPRNLLLASDLASAWILDLDRGRFVHPLGERERRDNLRRLYRAVRRRESRARAFLPRSDYLRFLRAYEAGRGTGGDWRAAWAAILRRDRQRALLHRLGWLLEGLFGAGPEGRDGAARPG